MVHTLDPAGVAAKDLRECLLLQLESRGGKNGVAWQIVADHLKLVELKQNKELARLLKRPMEHIVIALDVIRHLDPRPGLRYSESGRAAGGAGRLHLQRRRRLFDSGER